MLQAWTLGCKSLMEKEKMGLDTVRAANEIVSALKKQCSVEIMHSHSLGKIVVSECGL